MDHFENIQSTNWQTIRFKPPPVNSPIGWRVEFRSMEVQMTDFENAAFSIFIVLLSRAILSFDLGFYMPISQVRYMSLLPELSYKVSEADRQVDENMQKAQQRDAARLNKYAFRRAVFPNNTPHFGSYDISSRPVSPPPASNGTPSHSRKPSAADGPPTSTNGHTRDSSRASTCPSPVDEEDEIVEMTIDEIINGRGDYPGLMGLVNAYLNSINVDLVTKCELRRYLDLIKYRAKGECS